MGKKSHKKIRKSNRRTRRRGGRKDDFFNKHSDVGLATFDVLLGGKRRRRGGNDDDRVKDLDVAMGEFDLFEEPVQNTSSEPGFADISMISDKSDAPNALNESANVFDEEDDDDIVPENSIPFDEDDWMNFELDEGFVDDEDTDRSDLNETTNESISFGGRKTKRRRKGRKVRKTLRRKKTMRKKRMNGKRKTRRTKNVKRKTNIKRIRLGGNIDRLGSPDFNPNVAFDRKQMGGKQMGGQNVGGNCTDPNFSIFNTPMLKLFPYRPHV